MSASTIDARTRPPGTIKVLVWDMPVRVFHWLTVLSFAGAYLTAETERLRLLHVTLGYTMGGLVLFRIVWGFVGTRYARFSEFVHGPARSLAYMRGLAGGHPEHSVGHNPAGALAIVAMLALAMAVTVTGWALYNDIGGEAYEELHEAVANIMLAVVGVHVAAVLLGSWLHHENLIGAMFTGYKLGNAEDGIKNAWRSVAAIMLVAVLAFWWLQWRSAPAAENGQAVSMQGATAR
jgi:cytochrome b